MNHIIIVDKENANSESLRNSLRNTKYLEYDIIDIKLEYYRKHKDEINEKIVSQNELDTIETDKPSFEFIKDDKYYVLGPETWKYLKEMIHLGPRSEGFYDVSKMDFLKTRNGSLFKFGYINYESTSSWLTKDKYDIAKANYDRLKKLYKEPELVEGISKRTGKPYYMMKYKVIQDIPEKVIKFFNSELIEFERAYPFSKRFIRYKEEITSAFERLMELGQSNYFGLDYETSGFPFDDKDFYLMGVAISPLNGECFYFDLDYIQRTGSYDHFKELYRKFLDTYPEILTYNQSFEMRATYLMLNKLYFFEEAGTINKLDGLVYKNFSLKYTAMKNLGVASWDDDFDYLNDVLTEMFKTHNINNYENSDIWKEVCRTYPDDIDEFKNLFSLYYGDSFKCIPYKILGSYCQLDAYYTVLIKKIANEKYKDPRAWSCYNNNLTLGALLGIFGANIDKAEYDRMSKIAYDFVVYGNIIDAIVYTTHKLSLLKNIVIPDLPDYVTYCLSNGIMPNDSKSILYKCNDTNDEYGIDYNQISYYFDQELLPKVIELIKGYGGLNDGWRRRSIFNEIDGLIKTKFDYKEENNILTFIIDGKSKDYQMALSDLIDYYNFNNYYDQLMELADQHKNNSLYFIDSKKVDNWGVVNYCKNIVNVMSAGEYDILFSFFELYKDIIYEAITHEVNLENFTKEIIPGSSEIEYKFIETEEPNQYTKAWNTYLKYSQMIDKFIEKSGFINYKNTGTIQERNSSNLGYLRSIVEDKFEKLKIKFDEVVGNHSLKNFYEKEWNLNTEEMLSGDDEISRFINNKRVCKILVEKCIEPTYCLCWSGEFLLEDYDSDIVKPICAEIDKFYNDYSKFKNNYLSYIALYNLYKASKKYYKVLTTYIEGQFTTYNKGVNESDSELISTERFYDWNTSKNFKMYSAFYVSEKKSKRWSAPMHTVPSKSEVKRLLGTPKGYLLSYFDISGAEVRAISYISKDEYMLDCYSKGIDPYINLAKFLQPGKDDGYYKGIRYVYKTLLLGAMYGMGTATLAERAGLTQEDAKQKYDEMFKRMTGIKKLMEEKGHYCREHHGLVESFLGDILEMDKGDDDRYERLGINQFIQNIAAVSLADGFCTIVKESYLNKENPHVVPVNVVHDSSQNYFDINRIFEMDKFYHKYLTEYLFNKYGIQYEFDLEVGANYYDMCEISNIDDNTILLEGNYTSLKKVLDKLENEATIKTKVKSIINKKTKEEITNPDDFKPIIYSAFYEYIMTSGYNATFNLDFSKYKVIIEKVA